MKNLCLLLLILSGSLMLKAQSSNSITEDKAFVSEGIEYGYSIRNVSKKEVNGKEYSRYEVTLYATNKSECSRILLFSQNFSSDESEMNKLAKFDCLNATGAKLTSRSGDVSAKAMYVTARVSTRDAAGKSSMENQRVQIGYYLKAGETVSNNVIFIVPLDEQPNVRVRLVNRATTL